MSVRIILCQEEELARDEDVCIELDETIAYTAMLLS
jgi:hypothetical protein